MFKSAVLIILCIFVMDLYCFEWLKQESTYNRKTKPGKILINKSSVIFSWIRKWFHSWDRMFWYFHSCSELVKKSKHPFYKWNYTTHWISSIYAWTIKNPTVIFRRALFLGSSNSLQNPLHSCYIPQKTFEFAKVNHFMVRQWSHDVIRSIPEYFTVIGFNISIMWLMVLFIFLDLKLCFNTF